MSESRSPQEDAKDNLVDARTDDDSDLLPAVYEQLRSLARQLMSREQAGQTLQATALVHEAFVRLSHEDPSRWNDRKHFYLVAARAMRRILVDRARQKAGHANAKNDGIDQVASGVRGGFDEENLNLVDLDTALQRLSEEDPRAAQLLTLRFFGGLSLEDAAETLGISRSTAKRDWSYAKAWLRTAMRE